jgi:hypothetical protein
MRQFIVLLLLLPLPLVSQVKILMPVVVKDASGKAVTDLKISDFQVSGPKNVSVDKMWLVQPATVSEQDTRTPMVVLYDAANIFDRYPDLTIKWLRSFLAQVAEHLLPITFYVNTPRGIQVVYEPTTPPEVLAAALSLTKNARTATSDPKVTDQAQKLKLLETPAEVSPRSQSWAVSPDEYGPINQTNSLVELAKRLADPDKRKAVLWLASAKFSLYSLPPLSEMATEQLNAAYASIYLDLLDFGAGTPDLGQQWLAECTGGLSPTSRSIWDPLWMRCRPFRRILVPTTCSRSLFLRRKEPPGYQSRSRSTAQD